jgi:hypothetical protein
MALLGVPDLPTEAFKHAGDRRIKPQGGGGGAPTQTSSTSYQTNIPEYAKPYVETMLGATQKQLFQGTPTEGGGFDITGFQPYKAYGGTYDEAGNQTSYDAGKGIADFQPMQTTAQRGIANMQLPGQYAQAMDVTGRGLQDVGGLMGLGYQAAGAGGQYANQATNPYAMQAYMSPYMQNVVDVQQREAQRQADIAGTQRNAQAVQAGAFGGSRQAIMDAEAARNLAMQKGDIQATGLQSAYQQAQQAQQYGAGLGLQGLQAGMAGVGQGIGMGYQGAGQLANLGQQQLAAQQGIYNLQNQTGAQQQALEQQKLNQAMQDYANAQQYPLMQLGTMSNMIRGLPMQASTTQQYQAQPSLLTQGIGAVGAASSLANAFGGKAAAGGLPREFKKSGIMSYDVGGEVESDLESASDEFLNRQAKESSSPSVKRMAQRILRERQLTKGPGMAGGGIVAFAKGDQVIGPADDEESRQAQGILMAPRPSGAVTENPTAPPDAAPLPQQAVQPTTPPTTAGIIQAAPDLTPAMKALQADVAKEAAVTQEARLAEIQAAKKAAGIVDPGIEQRAKLMAERANAEDEAQRNKWLRTAEFFAKWGSTPGPTLVAGMAAVREVIPNIISDDKEAKKIRMEIDKSIAGLDEATRLEKKGDYEAAAAIKNKWADRMQTLNLEIIKIQEDEAKGKRADERQATRDKAADTRAEAKDVRNAALQKEIHDADNKSRERIAGMQAAIHKAEKQQWNEAKWQGLLTNAVHEVSAIESKISGLRLNKTYTDSLDTLEQFKQIGLDKLSPAQTTAYNAAAKTVNDAEGQFTRMRKEAEDNLKTVREKVGGANIPAPSTPVNRPAPKGAAARGAPTRAPIDSFYK